jgi:hypothetical protein
MSLTISERTTNYTHSTDNIMLYQNKNGSQFVSRREENYKYFQTDNEVHHAIEYLVIKKGFLMDSDRNGIISFSHSHNDMYNFTYYYYDTAQRCMTKVTEGLLNFV